MSTHFDITLRGSISLDDQTVARMEQTAKDNHASLAEVVEDESHRWIEDFMDTCDVEVEEQ
jgi:hypothetical protein